MEKKNVLPSSLACQTYIFDLLYTNMCPGAGEIVKIKRLFQMLGHMQVGKKESVI